MVDLFYCLVHRGLPKKLWLLPLRSWKTTEKRVWIEVREGAKSLRHSFSEFSVVKLRRVSCWPSWLIFFYCIVHRGLPKKLWLLPLRSWKTTEKRVWIEVGDGVKSLRHSLSEFSVVKLRRVSWRPSWLIFFLLPSSQRFAQKALAFASALMEND